MPPSMLRSTGWAAAGLAVGLTASWLAFASHGEGARRETVQASTARFVAPGAVFRQGRAASPDTALLEPTSARVALERFLAASAAGDDATAWLLLDREGHRAFPSVAAWRHAR